MGKITILSKSSNNSYSYTDAEDINLTANGNFEMDEQQKRVLSANGNIFYGGLSIANFSTSMYNGILQYQLYGTTADNTAKAFQALSGVQEQLREQVASGESADADEAPTNESKEAEADSAQDAAGADGDTATDSTEMELKTKEQ